jgi:ribosomal-protein-alanine N-acetyltransferase
VAEDAGQVVGFLIARQEANDIEILNLAVQPEARRRGAGTALLTSAIDWGKAFHAENALLEVRASNLTALEFYKKHGFLATGRRLRYYTAPVDDALVLTARIG